MSEENVKVAVRVRPFNKRERERNATCIVGMNGPTTIITDPSNNEEKKFNFDYSYWSHDGSKEDANGYYGPDASHPHGKIFADQKRVFEDLGLGVLKNAWEGYNSTLFAYGQTGSGKSWSIVGYGINKGVVPLFCEKMFQGIDEKKAAGEKTEYEVNFSMLEIYNEQVRDLLDSRSKKSGLRVRQHPKMGFYADGLRVVPVNSYAEIEQRMEDGTTNRTVAATNMNATSSRAHTIVGITLLQKFVNAAGEETTKSAVINLVDLAGSERAESTGATGDRLKEGAAINQSLSCLGNCIAALAEKSSGKNTRVPYRDSVLTKLLKNALGGNSKTIMIAAVSPADINYDESLSTLRYADRAKQIKTTASVNEDPTEKLIRELQEENEKLKAALAGNPNAFAKVGDDDDDDDGLTEEERKKEYESIMEENARQVEEMKKTFEEKLALAREQSGTGQGNIAEIMEKKKTIPHLSNLNPDPQLTGHIVSFLDSARKTVGKKDCDLVVMGPRIGDLHAVITEEGGSFHIEPASIDFKTVRNGNIIGGKVALKHNDRLRFGSTMYFVYINPKERDASKEQFPEVTYESAQEEAASKWGFDMDSSNKTRDEALLKEDMIELMPSVEECNSISEELDKKMKFELMIVSPEARGQLKGRTEVMIKVVNLETKHEWIWPREKFLNRKFLMQEMYENFQDGEENWDVPQDQKERDPFEDDYEAEFHIGSVKLWLQSLGYLIDIEEQLEVTDFKGQEVGLLNVVVSPCDKKGKPLKEDTYVDNPLELKGKDLSFNLQINSARGLPNKFTDVYAKYTVYMDEEYTNTSKVCGTANPDWKHKKQFNFTAVDEAFINYLNTSAIMVQIWGKQKPPKTKKSVNTAQAMMAQSLRKGQVAAANTNTKRFDPEKVKYMMEVAMLKKRQEMMELKMKSMKRMLELAEEHKKKKLSTKLIKDIYHAQSSDAAEKCLKLVPQEKDDDDSDSDSSDSSDDEEKTKSPKKKEPVKQPPQSPRKDRPDSVAKKSSTCVLL
ncbi:LOW QUALITY PROTEIN: kinesin-like protein KIF28P [Haliotis rubra]|uniref:LOW QUALITY PROTEIN: kinesin-like protein KIF28P n=1 Tax=Haliotis rubra TaxID=36100 RepID=UPI001EE513AD|nr:LOW QUALITY PROTEIN: kinesin-like protein KIF28P [Haliotis rubra]